MEKPGISCLFDPLEVHDHHFARAAHGQALSLDEAGAPWGPLCHFSRVLNV